MNERDETIRKKLEFYFSQNIAVHIKKKNNWFHNGKLKSINSDHCILIDEKEGEMPIFFVEIFEIQKREKKPKEEVEKYG